MASSSALKDEVTCVITPCPCPATTSSVPKFHVAPGMTILLQQQGVQLQPGDEAGSSSGSSSGSTSTQHGQQCYVATGLPTSLSQHGPALDLEDRQELMHLLTPGILHTEAQRHAEASAEYKSAFDSMMKRKGPEHVATLNACTWLIKSMWQEQRFADGLAYLRWALPRLKKHFGEDDVVTMQFTDHLGLSLLRHQKYKEAADVLRPVMTWLDHILKTMATMPSNVQVPPHIKQLVSELEWSATCNFGLALAGSAQHADAAPLLVKVAEYYETRQEDRQLSLIAINNLVPTLLNVNRLEEAETWALKGMRLAQTLHGPEHAATITGTVTYCTCLICTRKFGRAASLLTNALRICKRLHGETHPETLQVVHVLAIAMSNAGQSSDNGMKLLMEGYKRAYHTLGVSHTVTQQYITMAKALLAPDSRVAMRTMTSPDPAIRALQRAVLEEEMAARAAAAAGSASGVGGSQSGGAGSSPPSGRTRLRAWQR